MIATDRHSPALLWALSLLVVLGVQLCGLHHGQASGLALSGLRGGYCSVEPAGFAPFAIDLARADDEWRCPLCQTPASLGAGWSAEPWLRNDRLPARPGRPRLRCQRRRERPSWPRAP